MHRIFYSPVCVSLKAQRSRPSRRLLSMMTQGGPAESSAEAAKAGVSGGRKTGEQSRSKKVFGTVLFGTMAAVTLALGIWQSDRCLTSPLCDIAASHLILTGRQYRYQWKVNLIEDSKKRMAEDSLDWRVVADSDRSSLQGRKIAIRGKFDHSKGNQGVSSVIFD